MTDSSPDKLTALQRDLLAAFFGLERGFYLTGGAALAGFYLRHRETTDLDLFALDLETFERGRFALDAAARQLGATVVVRQHAPGFARSVVTRGADAVVVDLVWERAAQSHPEKREIAGIRVDPIEEILATKLTTVLSRAEVRDLVDLLFLERAGWRVEQALPAALAKDGGCTPAALAWVLSEVAIPDKATVPGDVQPAELREFVKELAARLRRAAFPEPADK